MKTETKDIFDAVKNDVFTKPIKIDEDVKPPKTDLDGLLSNTSEINRQYHTSEIKLARTIIRWAMIIFSAVTASLIVMMFLVLCKDKNDI